MAFVVVCDFDGTITLEDTGKKLLSSLTDENWRYYDNLVIEGKMGTREALLAQYNLIKEVDIKEVEKIISSIQIDETFFAFYRWLREKNLPFMILSDGFIENIRYILKNNGIEPNEVVIKANSAEIVNGSFQISFLTDPCEHGCANCKYSHVKKLKDQGYSVVYIGDGLSDILPAQELADYVFAKIGGDLARKLKDRNNVKIFQDFEEIRIELEKLLEQH